MWDSCPSPSLRASSRLSVPGRSPDPPLRLLRRKKAREVRACYQHVSLLWPDGKQLLPILDRLTVAPHLLYDFARDVRLDLIQQFHRLDNTQHLSQLHRIPYLNERRGTRRRRLIECAHDRRFHHVEGFFRD